MATSSNPLFRPTGLDLPSQGMTCRQKCKQQYNTWQSNKVHTRSIQVHAISEGFNVAQNPRISKPGWMGVNASQDVRGEIQEALTTTSGAQTILSGIKLIPYLP